jgi:hypothetical protein
MRLPSVGDKQAHLRPQVPVLLLRLPQPPTKAVDFQHFRARQSRVPRLCHQSLPLVSLSLMLRRL